ncbi:hypothetical protein ILYODFUR_026376 [Ilyodon furcidens]|uniref:Uncharacterized protein n=1 Tax=Ilyodon furcidens TaxID=33524 RepID=A0ABV0VIT1_9TELE
MSTVSTVTTMGCQTRLLGEEEEVAASLEGMKSVRGFFLLSLSTFSSVGAALELLIFAADFTQKQAEVGGWRDYFLDLPDVFRPGRISHTEAFGLVLTGEAP